MVRLSNKLVKPYGAIPTQSVSPLCITPCVRPGSFATVYPYAEIAWRSPQGLSMRRQLRGRDIEFGDTRLIELGPSLAGSRRAWPLGNQD